MKNRIILLYAMHILLLETNFADCSMVFCFGYGSIDKIKELDFFIIGFYLVKKIIDDFIFYDQ